MEFMEGYYAWEDGRPMSACPYTLHETQARTAWQDGWKAAEKAFRDEGDCVIGRDNHLFDHNFKQST